MPNYIVKHDGREICFYYRNGIKYRIKSGGSWGKEEYLYPYGHDGFCVYAEDGGYIHLICTNDENDIIYFVKKEDGWNRYLLTAGKPEIAPDVFMLLSDSHHMNLFYSAVMKNEPVLVHCILGVNAKPEIVARLMPAHTDFALINKRVYYTNENGVLGWTDYSDGKPAGFNAEVNNACSPSGVEYGGGSFLSYKIRNTIYVNGKEILEDYTAERPILMESDGKLMLQWRSGGYVKYIVTYDKGENWSVPMRYINSARPAKLFMLPSGCDMRLCYGYISGDFVNLFGASPTAARTAQYPRIDELRQLRAAVDKMRLEIELIKSELAKTEDS